MKTSRAWKFWLGAAVLLAAKSAGAADAAPAPLRVALVGDSTVCNYPATVPTRGWGQFMQDYFQPDVAVLNQARSGRSTKTFIAEGLWAATLKLKPAFVLIQFGHNDSHGAGHPESTDAALSYRDYLRCYIDDARAAGATPVLVTPMCRRTFGADGKLVDALLPYVEAMKAVAAEKKVGLLDLHTASAQLFQRLGKAGSAELANQAGDDTHFNERGARAMASLVIAGLPAAAPDLAAHLKPSPPAP